MIRLAENRGYPAAAQPRPFASQQIHVFMKDESPDAARQQRKDVENQ